MNFTNRIKPLIDMFYYTGTGAARFLAWMKARPDYYNIDFKNFNSKIVNKEIE